MAGFLYYVPGADVVTKADLPADLAAVIGKAAIESRGVTSGPDGNPGAVFLVPRGNSIGYYPDKQTWHKCTDDRWVGWVTEDPPRPADLEREEVIGGHEVELGGELYMIPVARSIVSGTSLPEALVLGPNGELVREALPQFAQISAAAERVWTEFQREADADDDAGISDRDAWQIAVDALALNYRLGIHEVSALRLLTTTTTPEVLGALVDLPALAAAVEKRTAASGENTEGE